MPFAKEEQNGRARAADSGGVSSEYLVVERGRENRSDLPKVLELGSSSAWQLRRS